MAPRTPLLTLVALAGLHCQPCQMESTLSGFEPACDEAVLRRYDGEARLALPGGQAVLVAYLPPDPAAGTRYGGGSGQPLTVVVGGRLAESRGTWLELDQLGDGAAAGRLEARLDDAGVQAGGVISGAFLARVEDARAADTGP